MQRVLVIKMGKGKIISKPWDFEAMCLVDDNRKEGAGTGALEAVYYLFEGTKATNEYLTNLPRKTVLGLCNQVWLWYLDDVTQLLKAGSGNAGEKATKLRDLYRLIFQAWGRLPDEIGRQRPRDVFELLTEPETDFSISDLPPESQAFYGL